MNALGGFWGCTSHGLVSVILPCSADQTSSRYHMGCIDHRTPQIVKWHACHFPAGTYGLTLQHHYNSSRHHNLANNSVISKPFFVFCADKEQMSSVTILGVHPALNNRGVSPNKVIPSTSCCMSSQSSSCYSSPSSHLLQNR